MTWLADALQWSMPEDLRIAIMRSEVVGHCSLYHLTFLLTQLAERMLLELLIASDLPTL